MKIGFWVMVIGFLVEIQEGCTIDYSTLTCGKKYILKSKELGKMQENIRFFCEKE